MRSVLDNRDCSRLSLHPENMELFRRVSHGQLVSASVVAANKGQKPKDVYMRRNAFDVKIDTITVGRLGGRSPRSLAGPSEKTADRAQKKIKLP